MITGPRRRPASAQDGAPILAPFELTHDLPLHRGGLRRLGSHPLGLGPQLFHDPQGRAPGQPLLQGVATTLIALAFFLLFQRRTSGLLGLRLTEVPAPIALIADLVCFGAAGFAIWARLTLGRNWSGALASVGENHELIVRGPYRYVRHPIYAGFLIAMLATALTIGTLASYLAVVVGLLAFLLRIPSRKPDAVAVPGRLSRLPSETPRSSRHLLRGR